MRPRNVAAKVTKVRPATRASGDMTRWITPRRRGVGKGTVEATAEAVVAGFSVEVFIETSLPLASFSALLRSFSHRVEW